MHHSNPLPLLLASITLVAGCDYGVQRGKYVVSGGGGRVLANAAGWIETLRGTSSDDLNAPDQLLLAFLFVGGDITRGGTGSSQTYVSSFDVNTSTAAFTIKWDRRSDIVSILQTEYDRSDGNVFILRMNGAEITSQQIATMVDSDAADDILTAVKQALPDDAEIQALAARSNM